MNRLVKFAALASVALALTALVSSPAQAQTAADLSAGYEFAHFASGGNGITFPYGFYVDVSDTVRPMVAVVGEFGGVYKAENGVTVHQYTYQGGVRVLSTNNPMVTPFGELLVGGASEGGGGSTVNAFSLQLGGGVNVKAAERLWVRLGVDYRRVFFSAADGGGENDVRVALGVVFPFGK